MSDGPQVDMENLAALARLNLSDEEKKAFSKQIPDILGFFQQLQAVDVSNVTPMAHPFDTEAPLRQDTPGKAWSPDRALLNAPAQRDDQLVVPKVVEDA